VKRGGERAAGRRARAGPRGVVGLFPRPRDPPGPPTGQALWVLRSSVTGPSAPRAVRSRRRARCALQAERRLPRCSGSLPRVERGPDAAATPMPRLSNSALVGGSSRVREGFPRPDPSGRGPLAPIARPNPFAHPHRRPIPRAPDGDTTGRRERNLGLPNAAEKRARSTVDPARRAINRSFPRAERLRFSKRAMGARPRVGRGAGSPAAFPSGTPRFPSSPGSRYTAGPRPISAHGTRRPRRSAPLDRRPKRGYRRRRAGRLGGRGGTPHHSVRWS